MYSDSWKMNLWEIRNRKGIGLERLRELTGISRGRLNNIENKKSRAPDLEELTKIAIALDVRITDLFESEYK